MSPICVKLYKPDAPTPWNARHTILKFVSLLERLSVRILAYSAIISSEEAQPSEKPIKSTHDATSMLRRPYMSLSFEIHTAKPVFS